MKSFDEIVDDLNISGSELSEWIEHNWVLPTQEDGTILFTDDDESRVRLLNEMINEIGVNYEAMPIILRSMDQVYNLRTLLGHLATAIQALPAESRQELEEIIRNRG
ncbi:hypothetical protein O4H49_01105 [Kiloniella laminariae]|uniref:HTH merR-type domain-containing protein n=1 Tax=Kiloniella laminariae TaxID=454162 RepID=A0ABT4LE29_9PROT|nr:chaperone modulator CbpM [Kiloniella laminariae]MCZ4279353.1 hypothetical protein [Kiloniella laminariae]